MKKAVVLLSGGLDSATCLAIARDQGYACHTIAFDYGQRTRSELDAAERVSGVLGALSHRVIELGMGNIGGSALTDHSIEVPENGGDGIPVTYVPARNTVFLSLALGLAEVIDAQAIFIGVNAVDYSGYPDCRPAFIEAFQSMATLATKAGVEGRPMQIETPLMHLSKAQIIQRGVALGLDYGLTVSCYQADDHGNACGKCDSCRLRSQGFEDALVKDPTNYQ
ncbi:MAG: 7-cyano-7-deazaguanine synthase [Alcanivorax borkumensis]|uniref:7-cyano-7-deazaguanine synthase n=1 Tax=Alcanivorax borkumensis (strain ATCC 700651 / DSM 11573 / NCIMB 13689 / SK2) TaxID=393595 RepID=QUEC_ALCBS|nr:MULTISPECIES: 7-cyano-7-deazaguanine synthase QueC [Alcanivorax]Q0VRI8.2 RecName: Full=7-cyano-7-deazaguanine synthase; AltName: Full=7-cyano-7-carbaguanine synthase; AltName: Full=PreQ(0) synthase; AltName: Full=Queuosine biosynthesis protein QueC [Alcanivorax borkumensis SK2]EUC69783.1 7-cyano-7-deazaguanine synthase [Alcanivorax sp. 97CO-5]OJH08552.1 MAG: 7-cyano-7-deazaguanine synthase [Alcanivorax borkumensis]PKG01622.1 7-cyano-7-deazaguanine synthase [Alcanivorax sp. 97CO-6]